MDKAAAHKPRKSATALWCTLLLLMMASLAVIPQSVCAQSGKTFTLVIDPGHGGNDPGAIGKKSREKNINLNVALTFGRYVEQNCPEVKVVYTRKTDVFIPLHERANIANRNKADLFISIHTNAVGGGRIVRGMETYTLGMHRAADNLEVAKRENNVILYEDNYEQHYEGFDPNSSESYIMFELMQDVNMSQSVDLAKFVQQRACPATGRANLGVKQAGFLVLRETSMPSCLIELGFISTPDEENYLNSSAGIDAYGRGIYQAFRDYLAKYAGKPAGSMPEAKAPQAPPPAPPSQDDAAETVYKVQIKASDKALSVKKLNAQLSSTDLEVDCYTEGGMYKYTVGSTTDYDEIQRVRTSVAGTFPDAFIIKFQNGKRIK